jgi:multicomponent Na+:H+ antiporter subunit E
MKLGATVHFLIALVWMFLSGNTTLGGLAIGLVAGFLLMAFFRQALGCQDYVRRVTAVLAFLKIFLQQVVSSNLRLVSAVLSPNAPSLRGRFISYSVEGLTEMEILLLCQCISLTPGTIVTELRKDGGELILHAFAVGEPDAIRQSLDEGLKHPILAFTR